MKYLKAFNENLPAYDEDYLKDSRKKLNIINGISKLILDNTNPNENIYFSNASSAVFINAGHGERKCRVFSIEYKDEGFRINYNEPDYRVGKKYYIGKVSWVSILELSYTELTEILTYLTINSREIGLYSQSITDKVFKKINEERKSSKRKDYDFLIKSMDYLEKEIKKSASKYNQYYFDFFNKGFYDSDYEYDLHDDILEDTLESGEIDMNDLTIYTEVRIAQKNGDQFADHNTLNSIDKITKALDILKKFIESNEKFDVRSMEIEKDHISVWVDFSLKGYFDNINQLYKNINK
tara:strand:- start:16709 stop:17593 length:885 start_codon:yes stop_codon:yes gene_type:complete